MRNKHTTTNMIRMRALVGLLLALTALLLAACAGSQVDQTPQPPSPRATETLTREPAVGTPNIRISPTRGKAGTMVTVVGGGFPANSEVDIRLAPLNTGATDTIYGQDVAGQHGNIQVTFSMPDKWPNGETIVVPEILVVATTPDFLDKATTQFKYEAFGTPQVTPTGVAPEHSLTLNEDPVVDYLLPGDERDGHSEANIAG